MKPEIERRVVPAQSTHKLRSIGGKSMRIGGYAAVFNALSQDLGGFKERILPGAFARCLRSADVMCLFNHDPNQVLGRSTAGTLTLKEDGEGLYFECELPNTSIGRDCSEMVSRGDIRGCSFAFGIDAGDDSWSAEGATVTRTISNISGLYDVGPVTYPAYTDTSVGSRALPALPVNTPVEMRSRIVAVRAQLVNDDSQARRRKLLSTL